MDQPETGSEDSSARRSPTVYLEEVSKPQGHSEAPPRRGAQYEEPRRPDGGCHQLDAVQPDEEEDWKSIVDEDEEQAFFSEDEDGGEEAWNDGESRGESVARSPMSLAAVCRIPDAPWNEAPASGERERAAQDERERSLAVLG